MSDELRWKLRRLQDFLLGAEKITVAFSGGVDSSFLLKTAFDLLGANARGIIALSELYPASERERALRVAEEIGSPLITCVMDPFSWLDFTANTPDRCYVCKKKIYMTFLAEIGVNSHSVLIDGTNFDDLQDDRPGLQAVRELGVGTPLADAGLLKKEIRQLSKLAGLSTWNHFSSSCLATRIAFHEPITPLKLELVSSHETFLHSLGFYGCRVRLRNDRVAIEIIESDFHKVAEKAVRKRIVEYFLESGVKEVNLNFLGRPDILI